VVEPKYQDRHIMHLVYMEATLGHFLVQRDVGLRSDWLKQGTILDKASPPEQSAYTRSTRTDKVRGCTIRAPTRPVPDLV
jgi:hypothetical protein